jgi:alpha-N-arabinofuranosidase
MLRAPHETWWSIDANKGQLLLTPRPDTLAGTGNPSFLARRVQHVQFTATTRLEIPAEPGVAAGLVAFQGERFHYFLAVRRDAKGATVFLEKHARGSVEVVRSADLPADGPVSLRITADHGTCDFAYSLQPDAWQDLVTGADAKLLTSAVAGGFVGATVGMHARLEQPAAAASAR